MVRRLKRHRQFFQPPDPTRWTRRIPSPLEVAFLEACRAGDVALVERSLSEDAELAGTRDVEGRDPLEVVAAQGGEETLAVAKRLLAAGLPRHAGPVARAAARGDEPLLALLLGAGWPTVDGRERHALMEAAVAEGAGRLDTATFGAVATTLVGAGADPNRADRWGDRPWGQATAEGRERLQALGAEPVARGPGRYDPETGLSRTLAALVAGAS
ncbi:MAG: hypothetical protein KC933_40985, partial [Myxococcales bacterium]|nr:hypothetical protein [Myxococcales bacterium]